MKKNVLVFEADNLKYALLHQQLTTLHYSGDAIHRAHLLHDALSVDPTSIHCIIAGIPEINSDNLSALKKLYNRYIYIPIIVISNSEHPDDYIKAISKGVQDVLVSGQYNTSQLERSIYCAVGRKNRSLKTEHIFNDYKMHFDNGPIPMLIIDSKSMKFLLVNNAAIEKYGYSREEFLRMDITAIKPTDDVPYMLQNYKSWDGNNYDTGYWRHKKKNEEVFYVHVYMHATIVNNVEARLCFVVDVNEKIITERKNLELAAQIKEQKEQLDNILSSISDAIWSRRADTMELLYTNNAYYRLFGYDPENLKRDKEHVLNSVYPDDMPLFLKAMKEIKTIGKVDIVYRYYHKDGNIKILKTRAKLKKGMDGQPDIINGVTNDITQEKEMYDAIRNSEQKLRATINNTRDLIWSVNTNLEILFCNEPYRTFIYELTGIIPEEGDYVLADATSESFIAKRKKDYQLALEGESFSTITEENIKGDILYLEISSNPIVNHEGRVVGVNCIARDISIQRKQMLKIRQQNEQLKEIAWIQSHKVRGPIASILGLIPLFDYECAGNLYNADILGKLESATIELDNIVKEIVKDINLADKN